MGLPLQPGIDESGRVIIIWSIHGAGGVLELLTEQTSSEATSRLLLSYKDKICKGSDLSGIKVYEPHWCDFTCAPRYITFYWDQSNCSQLIREHPLSFPHLYTYYLE